MELHAKSGSVETPALRESSPIGFPFVQTSEHSSKDSDLEPLSRTGGDAALMARHATRGKSLKRLAIAATLLLLALGAYNALIWRTSAKSLRHQFLTRLANLPSNTECIFLGNSLVEAGCSPEVFRAAWASPAAAPPTINLALGATSPVEHYLILDRALQQPIHPKLIIYGFFDDQLFSIPSGNWSDLVGNRAISYYFAEKAAALYAPGSHWKRWQLALTARIPMVAERSSLWTRVELLRRRLGEIGMPKHKTNRYGRVDDFAALEATDVAAFNQRCAAALDKGQQFSPAIQGILSLAQKHNARLVFVEMPMPSRHRSTFYSSPQWSALRTRVQTLAEEQHCIYISAADWVRDDSKFEDATHLSEQGAEIFSRLLAGRISKLTAASLASAASN
jgi:hypothetical protein